MHLWADFEILFWIAVPLILQVVSSNENQQQTLWVRYLFNFTFAKSRLKIESMLDTSDDDIWY